VISDFWVDALLGLLILVAVTIDAVIVNRLRDIWARAGLEMRPVGEAGPAEEKESHVG